MTPTKGEPLRKHPEAKVGDCFGDRTVTRLIPRGGGSGRGRSDERVVWRCVCGATGESYVFNMRGKPMRCTHGPRRGSALCVCGEMLDDHRPGGGECLEDDCECTEFEAERARA